jgi:hypothetical protein
MSNDIGDLNDRENEVVPRWGESVSFNTKDFEKLNEMNDQR